MTVRFAHYLFFPRRRCAILLLAAGLSAGAQAAVYPLPPEGDALIGKIQETQVRAGETLLDIGRRYSVGIDEMTNANPGIDPWLPPVGHNVVVPTLYVLPNAPRVGIVVNLPELRLYYYPPAKPGERRVVMTYPLGIGSEGRAIPYGSTKIIEKKVDPVWTVPESIRAEHAAEGEFLPKLVPPGPDNPLGKYALRLGFNSFLIHSTNRPFSVGMRISHGCLRMFPENIEEFYPQVALGTPVRILDQPYKAGWHQGAVYFEAHPPMAEAGHTPTTNLTPMVAAITSTVEVKLDDRAWQLAVQLASKRAGIPAKIFVPAPPAATAQAMPLQAQDPAWMVQVGVFRDIGKAKQVTQLMRRMELPVLANSRDGAGSCQVLVGPFPSREEAMMTGQRIYKNAGLENLLVPAARFDTTTACALN
ncbi:MAG: L,D-transpeptidase family protein [Pseudomonadota bacterium]